MATENQALGAALGTDMKPAPFKEPDYSKLRTLPQVFVEQKRIGDLEAQTAGELKQAELTQKANVAGEQAKAATEIADKAKTYVDDAKKKEAEFPYPEFHPTKDNAETLGGLFSIVSTLGIMLGSSGKQSGLNAMNAMSGMMTGWQKGRADLFKREKEEFDKEFNRIKTIHESLRKDLEDYMKLLPYDKEAAMYKASEISAKAGSDSIINSYIKNGQAQNAMKLLDSAAKLIEKEDERRAKAAEKTQKATQQQFRAQTIINALGGVSSAVESISKLPAGTTSGVLPNLVSKDGMFNAVRNMAGRKMSSAESKALDTLFKGVSRNLAAIEASGAATGLVGLAQSLEALSPKAGDSTYDAAIKMADIRRVAAENVGPLITSGLLTKEQAQTAQGLVERLERAIPYTTDDVINAKFGGKQTIGEKSQSIVEQGRLNQEKAQRLRELEAKEKEQ